MTDIEVLYDAAQLAERREQRRYDLVKTIIGAWASDPDGGNTMEQCTRGAVMYADIILAELEKAK
jgi:hypothetical protein